jgi:hypothetical protein
MFSNLNDEIFRVLISENTVGLTALEILLLSRLVLLLEF